MESVFNLEILFELSLNVGVVFTDLFIKRRFSGEMRVHRSLRKLFIRCVSCHNTHQILISLEYVVIALDAGSECLLDLLTEV